MATKLAEDLGAVQLVVEALEGLDQKDQERVLRWAREKLGLPTADSALPAAPLPSLPLTAPLAQVQPAPAPTGAVDDIKSFVEKKNPQTDVQFAATVAYYYRFSAQPGDRKDFITKDDLQEACRKADRQRLTKPAQTLVNAYHDGLLDRGTERGAYTINAVGENLVVMSLPGGPGSTGNSQRSKPKPNSPRKPSGRSGRGKVSGKRKK